MVFGIPARDQIYAFSSESTESEPLDHQGIPYKSYCYSPEYGVCFLCLLLRFYFNCECSAAW